MNQVDEHFAGVERHHLRQNLPAFHQFMNGNASTSNNNVLIHLNGTGESVMQSSNLSLQSDTPVPLSRKRKRSSASFESIFKCSFCPKKFANQNLLNLHLQDCQLTRTHVCNLCGKRFKARGGLQQHSRTHLQDEDRPYQCSFCPKKFNQKSHLDQHERIHTGEKPFLCQFCGRGFRQRSQQIGHETTHTGGVNHAPSNTLNQVISSPHAASMVQQAHQTHLLDSTRSSFSSADQSSGDSTLVDSCLMNIVYELPTADGFAIS